VDPTPKDYATTGGESLGHTFMRIQCFLFGFLGFLVFYVLLLHLLFFFFLLLLLLLLLKLTPGVGSIVDPPTLCFLCLLVCLFVCLFSWFTLMGNVLFVSWVEGSWKFYLNRMPFRF
jgi:hypothetical protein